MFDVHTHCHQPEHRGADWRAHSDRAYGAREWAYTPDDYSRSMRKGGVTAAVVCGVTALAAGLDTPNDFVEDFSARADLRTVPFMSLDLTASNWSARADDGVRRGFRGVKLYPTAALFDPADPAHDSFYERCVRERLVLLWHMGATPVPTASLALSNPLKVDEVARRHPDLVQIIAHLAHPWQREAIITIRKNTNVFADVSGVWARPQDGFQALVRAQEWGVVDKLLFGSDYPHWTPAAAIEGLRSLAERRPTDMPHIESATIEHLIESDHLAAVGLGG